MVRTPRFHHQGPEFDPWSGNYDPTSHAVWQKRSISKQANNNNNNNKKQGLDQAQQDLVIDCMQMMIRRCGLNHRVCSL